MFKTPTLSDQVYEHLLREISAGALVPGQPLRELELVTRLGVSRTPIREALARLAEYGLVEARPNRSTRVRRLEHAEILHVYQVREVLESLAVQLACGRLTPEDFAYLDSLAPGKSRDESPTAYDEACYRFDLELHRRIAQRSGNPILAQEIRKLHDQIQVAHKNVADRKGRLELERRQHLHILECLRAGDTAGSIRAVQEHLHTARDFLLECLVAPEAVSAR